MSDLQSCPQCSAPLPKDAPASLCPACLLKQGFHENQITTDPPQPSAEPPADSADPSDSPAIPGYEILREISHGGQGVVYQAVQLSTKRKVAIKVLLDGAHASRHARRRFDREVELVASLKHPNIISVFDSGSTPDRRQYYVMDYVRGEPITQYVRAQSLPLDKVLQLFKTVCDAVNHAHQKGVIHRDLKPSNILVDAEGSPRILDFGLAKTTSDSAQSLVSLTGQIVGTLPYMSPEQTRGNPDTIDTRTDVYALGVIFFELLTGDYPYPVVGPLADVIGHITHTEPAPLRKKWSTDTGVGARDPAKPARRHACPLDGELETIAKKALAKTRERRYQSAGELGRDVAHYLAKEPLDARRDSALYLLGKTFRRHRLPATAAALIFLVILSSAIALSILYGKQGQLLTQVQHESAAARDAEARATAHAQQEELQRKKLEEQQVQIHQEQFLNRMAIARAAVEQKDFATARKILVESKPTPDLEDDWRWTAWQYLRSSGEVLTRDLMPWFPREDQLRLLRPNTDRLFMALDVDHHRLINSKTDAAYAIDLDNGTRTPVAVSHQSPLKFPGVVIDSPNMLYQASWGPYHLPNGAVCQSSYDNDSARITLLLYRPTAENQIPSAGPNFQLHLDQQATCMTLSHDGQLLAVGFRNGRIVGYKINSEPDSPLNLTQAFLIPNCRESITTLAFSNDDQQIHAISDGMVYRVWYWNTFRDVRQVKAHTSTLRHIAFSPDAKTCATASYDGHVKIWSLADWSCLRDIAAQASVTNNFGTLAFFPDSRHLLTSGPDSYDRIWDLSARALPKRPAPLPPGKSNPDQSTTVPNVLLDQPVSEFFTGANSRGVLTPDGKTLYTTNGYPYINLFPEAFQKWDLSSFDHPFLQSEWHLNSKDNYSYNILYYPPTQQLITANTRGDRTESSHIFNLNTNPPTLARILNCGGDSDQRDLDLSPDGSLLALATWQGRVSLWDWQQGKQLALLDVNPGRAESSQIPCVRFHPSRPLLVAASEDSRVTLFSTKTFRKLATLDVDIDRKLDFGPFGSVKEAAFLPDGKTLAIGVVNNLWLVDLSYFDPQINDLAAERDRTKQNP